MRFLLDHDVPSVMAHLLRHWGHEAIVLREVLDAATPDEKVFAHACEHDLILITCNRDHFLRLAWAATDHPGLIILIRRRSRQIEGAHLHALLADAGETGLRGNINFA